MSAQLSNSPAYSPAYSPSLAPELPRPTEKICWRGLEFSVSSENIAAGTQWAIHENRHAVVVHLSGAIHQLESEFEGCGAVLDPPMPGEVWMIPAGTRYASQARGSLVRYAELYLDPACLQDDFGAHAELLSLTPRAGHWDEFLYSTVRRLTALLPQTDDLSQMLSQSLCQSLRLHICKEYNARATAPLFDQQTAGLSPQAITLLREYIDAHMGERLTLDTLAALVQMSSHHLLTAFRQSFGTTPAQYIIAQRLRRARWRLAHTKQDITTIALETGFASHSHLTTAFKSRLGLTPQMFRQSHHNASDGN